MKRVFRIAVLSIFTLALTAVATPAQAAEHGYYREQDYRHARYIPNDRYYDNHYYDNRRGYYDHRDNHAGRSAAIIGGSAAAGAVIGAAAGHGQGAAIGAVIGGIGGFIADQSVRHHDRR
ncbi:MAG TPA: hypothetical protein VK493_08665 [Bryobacteraceae bacterium]|nr:hypothetical protein [Bryobacteraceae bacterium]